MPTNGPSSRGRQRREELGWASALALLGARCATSLVFPAESMGGTHSPRPVGDQGAVEKGTLLETLPLPSPRPGLISTQGAGTCLFSFLFPSSIFLSMNTGFYTWQILRFSSLPPTNSNSLERMENESKAVAAKPGQVGDSRIPGKQESRKRVPELSTVGPSHIHPEFRALTAQRAGAARKIMKHRFRWLWGRSQGPRPAPLAKAAHLLCWVS